jgi:hypothetical protein
VRADTRFGTVHGYHGDRLPAPPLPRLRLKPLADTPTDARPHARSLEELGQESRDLGGPLQWE